MIKKVIVLVVFWVVPVLISSVLGYHFGKSTMINEARQAGVGEYYLDSNDNKQFRFKSPTIFSISENPFSVSGQPADSLPAE